MSNNIVLLNKALDDFAEENEIRNKDRAFELFATLELFKDDDLSVDEVKSGLIGGRNDGGIDGFYLFFDKKLISNIEDLQEHLNNDNLKKNINELNLYLIQYKNSKSKSPRVIEKFNSMKEELFNLEILNNLEDDTIEEYKTTMSEELIEKIVLFKKSWLELSSNHINMNIYFYHVTKHLGVDDDKYDREVHKLEETIKKHYLSDSKYKVKVMTFGAIDLLKLYRQKPEYKLDINLKESPINMEFKNDEFKGTGYLAVVNIIDFKQFISDDLGNLRKYLFESNVRDYQNSTEINKQILNTLTKRRTVDFWWLNNGVTILANNGTVAGKKITLDNIQIVNGLQTSYSIYKSDLKDDDKRSIFVKIIITEDEEIMDDIIKSTNSQNYIHPSQFRSRDIVQRNIEEHLKGQGLYYDRRKNYYKNEGKPIKDIISINDMTKAIYSIVFKDPCKARQSPGSLTKNEKTYNKIFNESRKLNIYEKSIQIVRMCEKYLSELTIKEDDKNKDILLNIKANYQYILSRILTSVILRSSNYKEKEIESINISTIDETNIDISLSILKDIITKYRKDEDSKITLTNLSKLVKFSNYITKELDSNEKVTRNKDEN